MYNGLEGNKLSAIPAFDTISVDLQRVEDKMRRSLVTPNKVLTDILLYVLDSGGKRLRPALALLASSFNGPVSEKAVSLAAAVELLHTATLVHDDLIDNSMMRRGQVTLNAKWSSGATVLTGDLIFAQSAALAAETANVEVISIFAETLVTICQGELRQLFGPRWREQSREDYYNRIYAKTASLFAAATEAGGVLCGLGERQIKSLREYGRALGMAFQIVDDVLDFIGDQSEIGKPVGSDLRQGIMTLPAMLYVERNGHDESLVHLLEGKERREHAIVEVVSRIAASDAIPSAFDEARDFVERGKGALAFLPDHPARSAMLDLADYVIERRM